MSRVRVLATLLATALASVVALVGAPAAQANAARTLVYYETVAPGDVVFIPACTPGPDNPTCDPRGAGSVFISTGTLSRTPDGPAVGTVETRCTTVFQKNGDYYGLCEVTLRTPEGTFVAVGVINESALERYVPQTIRTTGGGTLTIEQIVYPNVFRLTLRLP